MRMTPIKKKSKMFLKSKLIILKFLYSIRPQKFKKYIPTYYELEIIFCHLLRIYELYFPNYVLK